MEVKCENCAYFEPNFNSQECHRFPPTYSGKQYRNSGGYSNRLYGAFPRVYPEDWCGEFKQVSKIK